MRCLRLFWGLQVLYILKPLAFMHFGVAAKTFLKQPIEFMWLFKLLVIFQLFNLLYTWKWTTLWFPLKSCLYLFSLQDSSSLKENLHLEKWHPPDRRNCEIAQQFKRIWIYCAGRWWRRVCSSFCFQCYWFKSLTDGDRVSFGIGQGPKNTSAANVTVI